MRGFQCRLQHSRFVNSQLGEKERKRGEGGGEEGRGRRGEGRGKRGRGEREEGKREEGRGKKGKRGEKGRRGEGRRGRGEGRRGKGGRREGEGREGRRGKGDWGREGGVLTLASWPAQMHANRCFEKESSSFSSRSERCFPSLVGASIS